MSKYNSKLPAIQAILRSNNNSATTKVDSTSPLKRFLRALQQDPVFRYVRLVGPGKLSSHVVQFVAEEIAVAYVDVPDIAKRLFQQVMGIRPRKGRNIRLRLGTAWAESKFAAAAQKAAEARDDRRARRLLRHTYGEFEEAGFMLNPSVDRASSPIEAVVRAATRASNTRVDRPAVSSALTGTTVAGTHRVAGQPPSYPSAGEAATAASSEPQAPRPPTAVSSTTTPTTQAQAPRAPLKRPKYVDDDDDDYPDEDAIAKAFEGLAPPEPNRFLHDVQRNEYYIYDRHDRIHGPLPAAGFRVTLYKHGLLSSRSQNSYLGRIQQFHERALVFSSRKELVDAAGVVTLNEYVPSNLEPEVGTWPDIWRFLVHLFGRAFWHLGFFLQWLAMPLQSLFLKRKPLMMQTAVVFNGVPGAGKDTLGRILAAIYGDSNVVVLNQDALDSRFQEELVGKLLVIANEAISPINRTRETANRLKPWITDAKISIEAKYKQRRSVDNHCNILFFSNDDQPVLVETDDRRYTVFRTGGRLPPEMSKRVYADLLGPKRQVRAFLAYLLRLKVTIRPGQVYETKARETLKAASAPSEEKFAEEIRRFGWLSVSTDWVQLQNARIKLVPQGKDDAAPPNLVQPTEVLFDGTTCVTASVLSNVYQHYCHQSSVKPRGKVKLGQVLERVFPAASSKTAKIAGVARQVWIGLPLHHDRATEIYVGPVVPAKAVDAENPSKTQEDATVTPISSARASKSKLRAEDELDDGDLGGLSGSTGVKSD